MSALSKLIKFPRVSQATHDKYQKQHDEIIAKVVAGKAVAFVGNATICHTCNKVNERGWVLGCKCGGVTQHGFLVKNGSEENSFMTMDDVESLDVSLIDLFSGKVLL